MVAAGGIDALVTAMRSHGGDVLVQQNCARALSNLTTSRRTEAQWLLPEASMRW